MRTIKPGRKWQTLQAMAVLAAAGMATAISGTALATEPLRPAAAAPAKPAVSATTTQNAQAAPGMLDKREIRAQLAPVRYTTIAAEIGAVVARLPVPEGGRFQRGQPLVQFDCAVQNAQLNKARAILNAADKGWQANKRLAELNSVGKVELDNSEAEVAKSRADVAAQAAIVAKCAIAAPFSGRIAEQKIREQQFAQPGQALLEILDDSSLELEFIVPSRWLAWVKPGSTFQVRIDETGKAYPAKVQRLGARVDPVSQSVKVVGVIDGKFNELMAGMSGAVMFRPEEQHQ
ncbi:efflux RND transporter periplasmic adaptor subunit [Herbaspirillum sp. RV1423]|uniref:efflux RND transporter periplasmic adaptor subunit n=1 Tax=Herbaspirillum sp. RV1423 TaxID=1443993 RepID=UPI0004B1E313|nr:efflux RND transporter periplasmic adaptor subunit [Herbaspirillum sp. RV1423]